MIGKLYALSETRGHLIAQIFRIYIGLYGLGLLVVGHILSLSIFAIYLIFVFTYLFLSFKVLSLGIKRARWFSLFVDTFFIDVFVFIYGTLDIFSLTLALLPLIGNVCLSDFHFCKYLTITIPASLYLILSLISNVEFVVLIIPFIMVDIIVLFGELHSRFQHKIIMISEGIDSFFTNKDNLLKSYRIYDDIIKVLKSKPLPVEIDAIYCFFYCNGLHLYNASKYVWSYQFENTIDNYEEKSIDGVKDVKDIPLVLNGLRDQSCRGYHISINRGSTYLFVVKIGKVGVITKMMVDITLHSLFIRLAKFFESERLQRNLESDKMTTLSEKANYVSAAVSSMHFVRNKLSPMKTFFSIIDDIQSETNTVRKERMQEYLYKDMDKMRNSFNLMIERANLLLDKSDTPFVYKITQRFTLKELFSEIRRCWQDYGLDESSLKINLQEDTGGGNCYVFYNREGMGLVLDNWISNISKYYVRTYSLELVENEQNVFLTFANGYDSSKSISFVRYYSNDNRAEINKNKWHGLANVKDFLDQMNIQGVICNDSDNIYFKMILSKTVDNEKGFDC